MEEQKRRRVNVFEDDEIPYEVELAFDHDEIMRDAIKKFKEVVK